MKDENSKIDHKLMSTVDILSLIGELEHLRRHCLLAVINAPEEHTLRYLVLASQCQRTRRKLQKKYFGKVEERDWCIVKSASRLLQMTEETANDDLDELRELKELVDSAILIATGEDISFCEACRQDADMVESETPEA